MEKIINWLSDLSTMETVAIVIFFVYLLACGIGFAILYLTGRGYQDLTKGLRKILERESENGRLDDINGLATEILHYYESYAKYNPSVHQRYPSVINWMDDILLQTNLFLKRKKNVVYFDEYYEVLKKVREQYESACPYHHCTSSQAQILEDISSLVANADDAAAKNLIKKTEDEFIRLTKEGIKNERVNYISVAIGVAGILVSVLMAVLQMFG